MRVVLLAATEAEALSYARAAQIATRDFIIPRTAASLAGLRLESTDLVYQFYSFINHPERQGVVDALRYAMTSGQEPRWERAGQ